MKIVYLTAGAAGMYCGSCMHDNTLARALIAEGCDVQLIPLYTPIRTDEPSAATEQVFYGGINMYLQQKVPLFRFLPRWMDRWLDQSWLIRWASSRGIETRASELGELAISLLRGEEGNQRKEIDRLVDYLTVNGKPDIIILTNLLVAGCISSIKRALDCPVLVTLQGDDIFLDGLPEPHRTRAFQELSKTVQKVDGFILHTCYYADYMQSYLSIPIDKTIVTPLGIDLKDFSLSNPEPTTDPAPVIGYLARLAPEKGLHVLIESFIQLSKNYPELNARLHIAGWLGEANRKYASDQFRRLDQAGLKDHYKYCGEVDRQGKLAFLRSLALLSVPTTYREPKGLYVLEALAAGVPVVQPNHGAFPELIEATGGGLLVPPQDPAALAVAMADLLRDPVRRKQLGTRGREAVAERFSAKAMALDTFNKLQPFLKSGMEKKKT